MRSCRPLRVSHCLSVPALTEKSDAPSELKTKAELMAEVDIERAPRLIASNSRPDSTSPNLMQPAIQSIQASNRPSGLNIALNAGAVTPVCKTNSGRAVRGPDCLAVFVFWSSSRRIRCCGVCGCCGCCAYPNGGEASAKINKDVRKRKRLGVFKLNRGFGMAFYL